MRPNNGHYSPESKILILFIDSFHKQKTGESTRFDEESSIFDSDISDASKLLLRDNRREIFNLLKNDKITWNDCTEELKLNRDLKNGKDFCGDDPDAQYLPAVFRYWGDLYEGLNDDGKEQLANSNHHFLILSAPYGLLRPFEHIQYYACQFGDKNLTYDIWTRNHVISKILSEYIQKYHISRVFDFTSCDVPAYHECINWDFIKQQTGTQVLHCYHTFAKKDQALKPFGVFVKDEMVSKPEGELLSIKPGAVIGDIKFSNNIQISENETLRRIIEKGENDLVEFKSSSLWSMYLSDSDIRNSDSKELHKYGKNTSRFIISRSIASFLNANGGNLLIGIKEEKTKNNIKIIGIESEYPKLRYGDRNPDGYRLMIIDMIIKKYIPDFLPNFSNYVNITFHTISGETICWLQIKPSNVPVFVEINNEELFFNRIDASTRIIAGKALVKYALDRFQRNADN